IRDGHVTGVQTCALPICATTSPLASIVRLRGASARLPMATIRPSRIPMSPEYQGEPVPSTICPLVMTMSSDCAGLAGTEASANRRINADFLRVILVLNFIPNLYSPLSGERLVFPASSIPNLQPPKLRELTIHIR